MTRLISYDSVKNLLKLTQEEASNPALTIILDNQLEVFESYCNRRFAAGSDIESFKGHGSLVPLKALPVDEGEAIVVTSKIGTDDSETLEEDEYEVEDWGIRLTYELKGREKITVAYKGGYAVDGDDVIAVPRDIKMAALYQAAFEFQGRQHIGGETINNPAGGSVTRPKLDLLPYTKKLLNKYRHAYWLFGAV